MIPTRSPGWRPLSRSSPATCALAPSSIEYLGRPPPGAATQHALELLGAHEPPGGIGVEQPVGIEHHRVARLELGPVVEQLGPQIDAEQESRLTEQLHRAIPAQHQWKRVP